mgnify:CR=1 FL=1
MAQTLKDGEKTVKELPFSENVVCLRLFPRWDIEIRFGLFRNLINALEKYKSLATLTIYIGMHPVGILIRLVEMCLRRFVTQNQ